MLNAREYAYALTVGSLIAFGVIQSCESEEQTKSVEKEVKEVKERRVLSTRTHVDDEREEVRRALSIGCGSSTFDSGHKGDLDHESNLNYVGIIPDDDLPCRDELLFFLEDGDDGSEADYEDCVAGLALDEARALDRFWTERLLMDSIVPRNLANSDYIEAYNAALFDMEDEQRMDQTLEVYAGQSPRPVIVNKEGTIIEQPSIKGTSSGVDFTMLVILEENATTNYSVSGMSTNGMCFAEGDDPVSTIWSLVDACDSVEEGY